MQLHMMYNPRNLKLFIIDERIATCIVQYYITMFQRNEIIKYINSQLVP